LIRVRVRGIASTALSKILIDNGYLIVQPSSIIRERFKLADNTQPADVTVKDAGEDEILVIGFHEKADRVYKTIVDNLQYVYQWVSPIGLHSVHLGVVIDKQDDTCTVDLGVVKGFLRNCRDSVGDKVLVSVEKPPVKPSEKCFLSYKIRVIGEYIHLIYGSQEITISEHVKGREKREFLIAYTVSKLLGSGLGAHLRSNSMYAEREDIEREINVLKEELLRILNEAKNRDQAPRTLYPGEFIGLIGLTSLAKNILDDIRDKVVSTIPCHHVLKTIGGVYSELVDFTEKIQSLNPELKKYMKQALLDYIIEKLKQSPFIKIIHVKPDGSRHELTHGYLHSIEPYGDGYRIVLTRSMKYNGVYDGLNIEKKHGDLDYMVVYTSEWFISHNYHRGGEWIGSYINLNTPPELLPGVIKYHDLEVDVVYKPGGKPEVVDMDKFEDRCRNGVFTEKLCEEVKKKIQDIIINIDRYVFKTP